jgi:hypothetical protein
MSDVNSSLPVRTENAGDVAAKIVDATTPSQGLGVDAGGRITVKLDDGAGNLVTSQVNGTQRALDVGINVGGVQIDPRAIRALTATDVVTAAQGAASNAAGGWFVRPTDGTNSQAYLATGEAKVSITQPLPAGTNSIGKVAQDNTVQWITSDLANGSATGGTAAAKSMLAGGIYNSAFPTLTTGQQSAIQLDSSARVVISPLTNTSVVKSQLQDNAGNGLTSAAAGGTRPLDVALRDSAGNLYSAANPMPVQLSAGEAGTEVHNYNTAASLAAAATSNHDYTVTATKTFKASKFWAAASGKLKIEVQVSLNGTVFTTKFVGFNSTSEPNIAIDLNQFTLSDTGTGSIVRVIRTNLDKAAMDVYSTISGVEV